jgi:hypothetical protein
MCAAGSVMICYIVERGSEMLMCAAVSVMVCHRKG